MLAIVYTGAFLSGTGQVGNVTCNGIISPGGATNEYFFGVGALTVSNLTMSSTAYLYATSMVRRPATMTSW